MTLRSKKVDLVYQEAWGILLAYNDIRKEASQAAEAFERLPNEISFKAAYGVIAPELIIMAVADSTSKTGRRLGDLRSGVASLCIKSQPRPSRPRMDKMSKTRYPMNKKAAPLKP